MIASRLVVVVIAAIGFATAAIGQDGGSPSVVPIRKLRDCDSVPQHLYFTPTGREEGRYDVDLFAYGDVAFLIDIKGCGANSDFHHVLTSLADFGDRDFFAIPLFESGADDFVVEMWDTEGDVYTVYDAGSDYEEKFWFGAASGVSIADVDQDGRYDFVAQWIEKFECMNGVAPRVVFNQETPQVIRPHSVCSP